MARLCRADGRPGGRLRRRRQRRRRQQRQQPGDRRDVRCEDDRPGVDGRRQGRGHLLHRQGHLGRPEGVREAVQRAELEQGPLGQAARVPGVRRRAAQPVRPAPGGQVRRVRHLLRRRGLDGGVRVAEVALRPDAVRRERKAEFIPATFDTATYDGKTWAVPKQSDAGFLYYRTDQVDSVPATWQEVYDERRQERRHRLPGRGLRGPDVQLPRDRVRRRRQGALRRRQEGRVRLAGEPQGAAVHGRRHQERRAPRRP